MPFAPLLRVRGNKTRTRAEQRRMSMGTVPSYTDLRRPSAVGLGAEKRLSLGNIAEGQGSILTQLQSLPSHGPSLQVPNGTRSHRRFSLITRMNEKDEEEPPTIFGFPAKTVQILMITIILLISTIIIFFLPSQPSSIISSGTTNDNNEQTSANERIVSYHQPDLINLGGWRSADPAMNAIFHTDICNIERVSIDSLSDKDFEQHYRFKWPVIITFPLGTNGWINSQQWMLNNLKEQYGNMPVLAGKSFDIVRSGGSGNLRSTLAEFMDHIMDKKDDSSDPMYIFDRSFYKMSGLPSTLHPPSFLKATEHFQDSFFFLGGSGSGASFHKHADSWNGVVFGRKRWFLYPPHKTPPGGVWPGYGAWDWFIKVYSKLEGDNKPLECIQEAGEIMYIPESFYHSTINIGDTVALGIQSNEATTQIEKLYYKAQKFEKENSDTEDDAKQKKKKMVNIFEELLTLLPDNTEVLLRLGKAYQDFNKIEKAIILTQRALDIDPYFVTAHLNLASLYASQGNLNDSELHYQMALDLNDQNWDVYAQFGDFLLNNKRPIEAAKMYQKGTKLSPHNKTFWKRLIVALQQSGESEEAQAIMDKFQHFTDEL